MDAIPDIVVTFAILLTFNTYFLFFFFYRAIGLPAPSLISPASYAGMLCLFFSSYLATLERLVRFLFPLSSSPCLRKSSLILRLCRCLDMPAPVGAALHNLLASIHAEIVTVFI
jgi:hypothetical protein